MLIKTSLQKQLINIESPNAFILFTNTLYGLIDNSINKGFKSIVFICIGTDRSTGDSLGPLVGYKISNIKHPNVYIHGSLENPVHAKNLNKTIEEIRHIYTKPLIIAIDACLGKMEHIGYVSIGTGPIKPGSAMNKDLLPIGDISIVGIVNLGGFMDFLILQNTRLYIVMKMAELISNGIKYVIWKAKNNPLLYHFFEDTC